MRRIRKGIFAICMAATLVFSGTTTGITAVSKTVNQTKSIKTTKKTGRAMKDSEKKSIAKASFKLFNQVLSSEGKDENVMISPASILYAFGMAENGAKGKTKSQLEDVVNGGIKTKDLNEILCAMKKRMEADDKVSWNVANSIWYKDSKDIKVKSSFLKKAKSYYSAEIFKAPFSDKTAVDINSWVNKNTKKMIPKIVDKLDSSAVMYLINAVAFEGKWAKKIEDSSVSKDQPFTNSDKSESKVTMFRVGESSYFELNGAYGFKKQYEGGKYSFVGIEMPEGVTPASYIKKLSKDGSAFTKSLDDMKDATVSIRFPEFKSDYDVELSSALKKLGAKNAFSPKKANLYNLFEKEVNANYYFNRVLHKTHIEVDQKGTKAAAVTAIEVNKCTSVRQEGKVIYINLDHPFVYAIVDNETNTPLFLGCVNSLK